MTAEAGIPAQHGPQSTGQEQLPSSWCSSALSSQQFAEPSPAARASCEPHGAAHARVEELVSAASTKSSHTRNAQALGLER